MVTMRHIPLLCLAVLAWSEDGESQSAISLVKLSPLQQSSSPGAATVRMAPPPSSWTPRRCSSPTPPPPACWPPACRRGGRGTPRSGETNLYSVHDGTQDGLLACGGYNPQDNIALLSCEEFRPATASWGYTAFALAKQRAYHGSWGVEEGTILLGGSYSEATSEIVKSDDGFTEFTFDLKYQTQYVVQHNFQVPISLSPGTLAPSRAHPTPP